MYELYNKMVEEVISGRMVLTSDSVTFEEQTSFEGIGPSIAKTYAHLFANRKDFDSNPAVIEGLKMVAGESENCGRRMKQQMIEAIDLLREDRYTRQAIVYLDTNITAIQFVIRNDTLETTVNVRSWDIVEDLPRDMIAFGILAQVVAKCLNVQVGYVYYTITSSYLYPESMDLAEAGTDLQVCLGPAWPLPGNVWYAYSLRAKHAVKEFMSHSMMNPGVMRVTEV